MVAAADMLFRQMADAADEVLRFIRLPIAKALDPNDKRHFSLITRRLTSALQGLSGPLEAQALRVAIRALDVDWGSMTATQKDRVVESAKKALNPVSRVLPHTSEVFELHGKDIVEGTKESAIATFGLNLKPDFTSVDQRAVQAVAFSQGNFVRNEYGRRQDAFGLKAKQIVAHGLERGLGRHDIGQELHEQLTAQGMNRSRSYWNVVASSFAGRARSWGNLSSFQQAGITYYVFESVLDEVTSEVCRFMHGKRFSVQRSIENFMRTEEQSDPEQIKDTQPWMRQGKDDDGNSILYYKTRDGNRHHVANVDKPGFGKLDESGQYSKALGTDALQGRGFGTPPLHGNCRSTIVADFETMPSFPIAGPGPVGGEEPEPAPPELAPVEPQPAQGLPLLPLPTNARQRIAVDRINRVSATAPNYMIDENGQMSLKEWGVSRFNDKGFKLAMTELDRVLQQEGGMQLNEFFARNGVSEQVNFGKLNATKQTADRERVNFHIRGVDPKSAKRYQEVRVIRFKGKNFVLDDESGEAHATVLADKLLAKKAVRARVVDLDTVEAYETGPIDKQKWAAQLNNALLKLQASPNDAAAQKQARELYREYLARNYGLQSRDVKRKGVDRNVFNVLPNHDPHWSGGAIASHGWQGRIKMQQRYAAELNAGMKAVAADPKRELINPNWRHVQDSHHGFQVWLHEEIHGHSPIVSSAYFGPGVGMEEAATEILARKAAREFFGFTDPTSHSTPWRLPTVRVRGGGYEGGHGAYPQYVNGLFNGVAKVTGHDKIHQRIEDALIKTRQAHSKNPGDGAEHVALFVDALGVTGPDRGKLIDELIRKGGALDGKPL